jgi:DNA repair photolyase
MNVITAETLLNAELIEKWGLAGEWSLAARVPKYMGAEWEGKVVITSPLVDPAPTKELAMESVEMCDMVLRLTRFHIRLLSKSPLIADVVAKELAERFPDEKDGAKARIIVGLSTGTLDDKVAAAIERHVPSPSARLKALRWLQDEGFRTFAMMCPMLPQEDPAAYNAVVFFVFSVNYFHWVSG